MGLDMYLQARKNVSHFSFADAPRYADTRYVAEAAQFDQIVDILNVKNLVDPGSPSAVVEVNVGYWRKANAIHGWFVENTQGGVDDCRDQYVTREQLQTLLDLVTKTLETKNPVLLPPTSGFFFGSYDIDEWYWSDLKHTRKMLTRVLSAEVLDDSWSFYYHSSW
jgi:hypothetical protein